MSGQILKTSVAIVILALAFSFPAAAKNWNQDEVTVFGDTGLESIRGWAIPWDKTPNYNTAKFYFKRYNSSAGIGMKSITVSPSPNPMRIFKQQAESAVIQKQMQTTSLLSYMLYDGGKLIVDEITPRFDGMVRNDTLLYSMSLGKSLTSYLVGHAVCKGIIEGLDHKLDDWPLIKGTLYEGQPLIDLMNMSAGDQEHSKHSVGFLKSGRSPYDDTLKSIANNELKNSRPSKKVYNYNGLPPNIVLNYLNFRLNNKLADFMGDVLQGHIKIGNPLIQATVLREIYGEEKAGIYRTSFRASRYDFLRIAIAMLNDWQTNNCFGQYLKEIYERRIDKQAMPITKNKLVKWGYNYWRGYGGFFHTDMWRMKDRRLMGMDGLGGQLLWIDFDKSRILYVHTVHGDYDHNKIALRVIKGEEDIYKLLDIKVIDEEPVIISQSNDRTTKYDRTVAGMKVRFKCLADYAAANDISDLPTEQEIESLTTNLEGNDYYRSKRQIVKAGISKEAMDANKAALVRLVNFEGTNDEYCAKPLP